MKVTDIKELEELALELGLVPFDIYEEALRNKVINQTPTDKDRDIVIKTLREKGEKITYQGVTYVKRAMSLDFAGVKKDKIKPILKELGYKNYRLTKGVLLCVPLPIKEEGIERERD